MRNANSGVSGAGISMPRSPVSADFDLTMVHISTLVELMPPRVAAKWRHIGTALKLDKGVLQSIAKRASNMYPEDFFSDMLHQWLKRGATLFHEKPSLSALCRALCGDSIGEESLGTSLEKSMRNMQDQHSSLRHVINSAKKETSTGSSQQGATPSSPRSSLRKSTKKHTIFGPETADVNADITLRRMHVSTLAEVLPPYVAAKWRAIGTSLKFDESVLDSIESAAGNISPEDCFSDMLYQWLSSGAPEHGKPTLRRLCKALRDGSVGEEILGICLEGSMEDMQEQHSSLRHIVISATEKPVVKRRPSSSGSLQGGVPHSHHDQSLNGSETEVDSGHHSSLRQLLMSAISSPTGGTISSAQQVNTDLQATENRKGKGLSSNQSQRGRGATAIKHPEEYALRHNVRRDIIRAIALDLTRFQESFVELGFITQQNASGIMSKMGITAERKAGELFQSFEWKLDSSQNRQITFEDFVSIFAVEEATRELAEKILGNYVEKVPDYDGRLRDIVPKVTVKKRLPPTAKAMTNTRDPTVVVGTKPPTPTSTSVPCPPIDQTHDQSTPLANVPSPPKPSCGTEICNLTKRVMSYAYKTWRHLRGPLKRILDVLCAFGAVILLLLLMSWHEDPPTLPPLIKTFVGREDSVSTIMQYLNFSNTSIDVVHIVGPPDYGKTVLATKVGHDSRNVRIDVYFIDIVGHSTFESVSKEAMRVIGEFSTKENFTEALKEWVGDRMYPTLLIFDGCDTLIHAYNENIPGIADLQTLSTSVKYILTSRMKIHGSQNFKLYSIPSLDNAAANELLGQLAPELSEEVKESIVNLTDSHPYALRLVGAGLRNLPDAEAVNHTINKYAANLIELLQKSGLTRDDKLTICAKFAADSISEPLHKLAQNLANFPSSFDQSSALEIIFDVSESEQTDSEDSHSEKIDECISQLDSLVTHSLLEINYQTERYSFRLVVHQCFLNQTKYASKPLFTLRFQLHFARRLKTRAQKCSADFEKACQEVTLDMDNFKHLFIIFTKVSCTSFDNTTLIAMELTFDAIRSDLLPLGFHFRDIHGVLRNILAHFDCRVDPLATKPLSQYDTFTQIVIAVANQETDVLATYRRLDDRADKIKEAFNNGLLSNDTYQEFNALYLKYKEELYPSESDTDDRVAPPVADQVQNISLTVSLVELCRNYSAWHDCRFYSECVEARIHCGITGYALGYGNRSCQEFAYYSKMGHQWAQNISKCQMQAVQRISNVCEAAVSNPTNCEKLQTEAFGAHLTCYNNSDFCSAILNASYLVVLFTVVRESGHLRMEALYQIGKMMSECSGIDMNQVLSAVEDLPQKESAFGILEFVNLFINPCSEEKDRVILFLLDSSLSINSTSFDIMKSSVANVAVKLAKNGRTPLGVIRFCNRTEMVVRLKQWEDTNSLNTEIRNIRYTEGIGTHIHEGINNAATALGSEGNRIILLFTDGQASDKTLAKNAADAAKRAGISIYAVGIGTDVNERELDELASSPPKRYRESIENFSEQAFGLVMGSLTASTCLTPQQSVSGQQQIGKLNEGQVRSLTYSLPPGGLTLELNASSGEVNVYVSYSIHNPTYFTADVITGGSGYFTRYVPPRDSPVEDSEYVFISLIAKKNNTNYSLDVTTGNVIITRLTPGPPENLSIALGANHLSQEVNFTWNPPAITNGVVTHYSMECIPEKLLPDVTKKIDVAFFAMNAQQSATIRGLSDDSAYNCSIFASNEVGYGLASSIFLSVEVDTHAAQ